MISRRAVLQSFASVAAAFGSGAWPARASNAPGITNNEIRIGQTMPYSGPLSAYGVIGKTDAAYFDMINEAGGVNGRKLRLISVDDAYDPPKTYEQTRRLVEREGVAFIFNSAGTWTNGVIRAYLNFNQVPHLFVASGAEMFADPQRFPWTIGWQPSYQTEAAFFGAHIVATDPTARIGVLYQDDGFGRDYVLGLKDGLGRKHERMIVETTPYESWQTNVRSQVAKLHRAGADTFVIVAVQDLAEQAINDAFDRGWSPARYLTGVSQSLSSTMPAEGLARLKGVITGVYDKDPSDPRWRDDAGFRRYAEFASKYMPQFDLRDAKIVNGFGVAETMVRVLTRCGDDLSRENIMRQATDIRDLELPMLLPGVKINTSPSDYHPIRKVRLAAFNGASWEALDDRPGGMAEVAR